MYICVFVIVKLILCDAVKNCPVWTVNIIIVIAISVIYNSSNYIIIIIIIIIIINSGHYVQYALNGSQSVHVCANVIVTLIYCLITFLAVY